MQIQVLALATLLALLSGCDSKQGETATAGPPVPKGMTAGVLPPLPGKSSALHDPAVGEQVYRNTCSICHRLGVRGAPRLGDKEDWLLRLAQGNETLYRHAINGYMGSKGSMPSRGSNARLSDDELKAAVDYMVRYSVPRPPGPLGSHVFSATAKPFTIR